MTTQRGNNSGTAAHRPAQVEVPALAHTHDPFRESIVKPPSVVRHGVLAAVLLVVAHAAQAQTPVTKAPPRLPPNSAQSSRIPAGVDTGTPASSDTLELGTPVPPNLSGDRSEMRTRSAAARAAARPKTAASAADCTRPAAAGATAKPGSTNGSAKAGANGASAPSPSNAARGTPSGC